MADSVVYAIAAGDRVKIGFTTNLPQRMKAIQSSSSLPIVCLGTAPRRQGPDARTPSAQQIRETKMTAAASQDMNTPDAESEKSRRVVPSGKPGQEKTK